MKLKEKTTHIYTLIPSHQQFSVKSSIQFIYIFIYFLIHLLSQFVVYAIFSLFLSSFFYCDFSNNNRLDERLRPVQLRRVVLGYPTEESWSDYRFDLSLNYKIVAVIHTYSENKPTLVSFQILG